MTCLMNYRDDEAHELQLPSLIAKVRSERAQLSALHAAVFASTPLPTGTDALAELRALHLAPKFEDTLWAMCMVNSRCFSETIDGERVSIMAPCCDFANHSPTPEAEYRYNTAEDAFQLAALRTLAPGVEACISYGCVHKSNLELMRDYGFVMPGNLQDRVAFDACATPGAPKPSLHAGRLMGAWGIEGAVSLKTRQFELGGASAPEILLRMGGQEGAAARRKVATLLSLGEFLREVPREVRGGVSAAKGKVLSEEDVQREKESALELQQRCLRQLEALPTSIGEDEDTLAQGAEVLGARRCAAVAARLEAKRVLKAAADLLQAYADSLEDLGRLLLSDWSEQVAGHGPCERTKGQS